MTTKDMDLECYLQNLESADKADYASMLTNLFGTSVKYSNNYYEPINIDKLKKAAKEINKIQKSNTILQFIKEIESVIKKGKIKQIKVMHNDFVPEGELFISYNLKSK